ncbi:MAG TPA: SpaH/EbpB family LPXTG-anchored major pilin [Candidatus Eubacterium avistercoris]|uniref:SpaH/EbpB family LPXTG-anchored major pilin n=1 Tax=Candidatus Eubacterium avistercoris TaxID=2838567 RepID=A0A9D2IHR1_9FIRM|nr:SpaH/EbpB family LPXTG-anchored major pilin [Candidatus Eubacterium avistercoris]
MKKKKGFRRIIALCLVMALTLAMSVSVFAADAQPGDKIAAGTTGSFQVTGFSAADTTEVTAYKIIDVKIDATGVPQNPMYKWSEAVADLVEAYDAENGVDYIDANGAVTKSYGELTGDEATEFLEDLTSKIKDKDVDSIIEHSTGGTATFNNMAMGVYLLTASETKGVRIYHPTTVQLLPVYDEGDQRWELGEAVVGDHSADAVMKSQEPAIGKDVNDKTVAVGDEVTYTLNVTVPEYPQNAAACKFVVGDKLSEGLEYVEGSIKIKDKSDAVLGKEFYTVDEDGGESETGRKYTFQITFTEAYVKAHGGETLTITYQAKITEDAVQNSDDLVNEAYIGYNHDPYDDSSYIEIPDEEKVFTYNINIVKTDKEDKRLAGAQFTLAKKENGSDSTLYFTKTGEGVYTYRGTTLGPDLTDRIEVSESGELHIQGIDTGTYVLKEVKAPEGGYVLPEGEGITIIVSDAKSKEGSENPDGILDDNTINKDNPTEVEVDGTYELGKFDGDKKIEIEGNTVSIKVVNTSEADANFTLPLTGGPGTVIFSIAGVAIMGIAVAVIVSARRRKA